MKKQFIVALIALTFLGLSLTIPYRSATAQTSTTIERVSVASDGTQGNFQSYTPWISGDGNFVVFESASNNLVSGDTNSANDIFVVNRLAHQIERISVASDGTQGTGNAYGSSISNDGRYIAFNSQDSTLVPNDTNNADDVFVHDRVTGQTQLVSGGLNGAQASLQPDAVSPSVISGNGRFVAFESSADNLVLNDTNPGRDIFVRDLQTGTTEIISVSSNGTQGNGWSYFRPSISDDGRYVAFVSGATNLVSGDTNTADDIFVHDRQTGQTQRVSVASNGTQENAHAQYPAISGDGRYVTFNSLSDNLVPGDTNSTDDVFVHDRQTGQTQRVSVASDGTQGNTTSYFQALSRDGRYVTFRSAANNLVAGDTNAADDIFVHDRQTQKTIRLSVASDGTTQGDAGSNRPILSSDGQYVTFMSLADNLVSNDTNGASDIFVAPVLFPMPRVVGTFKQTDPPWGGTSAQHYKDADPYDWQLVDDGTGHLKKQSRDYYQGNYLTVRGSGCLITSIVNMLYYWGITTDVKGLPVNPRNINDYLSQLQDSNGKYIGYVDSYLNWPAGVISMYAAGKVEVVALKLKPGQTKEQAVDEELDLGQPVIVGVPYAGTPNGHWVVITGHKVNGHYPIRDPGGLQGTDLGKYSDIIGEMKLVRPTNGYIPQQTIVALSPVELMITDSLGRRTGYDPTTQSNLNEIPGADYEVEQPIVDQISGKPIGEPVKFLDIPQSIVGDYQLTVTGTGNGHYGLEFQTLDSSGNLANQSQEGIAAIGSNTDYQYTYDGNSMVLDEPLAANAGQDQTLTDANNNGSESVTLDASGSTDSSGTIVSYTWVEDKATIATGVNPTLNFAVGTHSITLIVKDNNGAQNSDDVTITILPYPQPNNAPPRNYYSTDKPLLTWNRVTGAIAYQLQVNDKPDFSSYLYFTATVSATSLSTTTDHLPNGTYYWRVRAQKSDGSWGAWSVKEGFMVVSP